MSENVRESFRTRTFGHDLRTLEWMVRYKADKPKGVALAQHVADTPLAKRMLEQMGKDDYQLMKTFQQHFGARLVHYSDQQGEVGKRPGWANDAG
jgi:hypothetical protein